MPAFIQFLSFGNAFRASNELTSLEGPEPDRMTTSVETVPNRGVAGGANGPSFHGHLPPHSYPKRSDEEPNFRRDCAGHDCLCLDCGGRRRPAFAAGGK